MDIACNDISEQCYTCLFAFWLGQHCKMFPAGVSSVLHYSQSVGPSHNKRQRVKIDDETKREKRFFIQLSSKALAHYFISKTSVTKAHLNEYIETVHGNF